MAVVEVHLKDDALGRVIDQTAEHQGVVEARPGPGPVGGNIVDGDKGQLVAGRDGVGRQ